MLHETARQLLIQCCLCRLSHHWRCEWPPRHCGQRQGVQRLALESSSSLLETPASGNAEASLQWQLCSLMAICWSSHLPLATNPYISVAWQQSVMTFACITPCCVLAGSNLLETCTIT